MALRRRFQSLTLQHRRAFSSSDTNTPRSSGGKEQTRAALAALRLEENPERILDICRSAALTPESHLDRIVFSKAISKLKELNRHDAIRAFIHDSMSQPANRSERYAAHCIISYGQSGLISDAVELFDKMPELGIERNIKTLNSLLFSCLLGREYALMRRIFFEFPRKYGLDPNLETYNTVLKGICSSGGARESHAILAEMERKGVKPSKQTFASVIEGLYSEESLDDVGKMLHLMKRYDMSPGIGIYNVRIQCLCKLGRLAEAKALLDGILSNGMKPNCRTYGHLIYGFCRQGELDAAKDLYGEMAGKGLKAEVECFFTLVHYLCQGKDFEGALSICDDCISNGWFPNVTTMSTLVRGLASMNKFDEARRVTRLLKKRFRRNAEIWEQIEMELPKETEISLTT
ncbi:pentatricopeptide repeat-containing protein, mitochondrial [Salvia divinorum]|uniref:Pentatricopeptide repeat-containing protein, mitochondrial n=1 Tax=Salvia divinorum TaxID=28513 RepID=A0ABD1FZU2_SALDI